MWIRAPVGTVLGIVRRFAVRSTGGSTVRGSTRRGVRRYRLTIVRVCAGLIGVRAARSRVRAGYGAGLGARFRAGAGVGFGTRALDGLLTGVAGGHGLGRADAEGRRTGVLMGGAVTVSFVDDRAAYLVVLLAAPGAGVSTGVVGVVRGATRVGLEGGRCVRGVRRRVRRGGSGVAWRLAGVAWGHIGIAGRRWRAGLLGRRRIEPCGRCRGRRSAALGAAVARDTGGLGRLQGGVGVLLGTRCRLCGGPCGLVFERLGDGV